MNPNTGAVLELGPGTLYPTYEDVPPEVRAQYPVQIIGDEEHVMRISAAVKEQRRRQNKAARKARKKGR